jgi:basic amino acid/polyamine antiporter, APA family
MLNTMIGASIFGVPSLLAARLGKSSPWAYYIAAFGVGLIAACLAEVSSQFRETGGPYLYARAAFGRLVGIQVGWLMWMSRITASSAVANLFISYSSRLYPIAADPVARGIILISLIGVLATVNYLGVTTGTRLSNFFTLTKLVIFACFVGGGLAALVFHPWTRVSPEEVAGSASDWFEALVLMVYAYGGFESALFVSGEARDPRRDAPFALLIAIVSSTLLYVSVQYVVIHVLPHAAATTTPAADVARRLAGPVGATLLTVAILVSIYGYLGANMLHTPRLTFAMGEQGDFPRFFAAVHPRFRSPHVSIVAFALLLVAFSIGGSFRWNAILSAASRLFIYGCTVAALVALRRKQPAADAFRLPFGTLFVGLALAFTGALVASIHARELAVIGVLFIVAFVNWLWARRSVAFSGQLSALSSTRPKNG